MPSTNTVCFEGLRVYRNAVVSHIRDTLSGKYPSDWQTRVAEPFQKDWPSIKEKATALRATGELETPLKDDADLLDVNHFFNLFEKYFNDLFSNHQEGPGFTKEKRQALLGWTRSVATLRNGIVGHPAEADVDSKDALMMLDSARRILKYVSVEAAEQISDLYDSISGLAFHSEAVAESRVLESTLPSRESVAPQFVGRQAELQQLHKWVNDPYSSAWLLAGDGGKGKTAIAYEFAVSIAQDPPSELQYVIWMSAKARQFEAGRTVDIGAPDFWDLPSALDCVLQAYGCPGIADLDIRAKERECREYLSLLPALVVLDDIDSLEDDDAVSFFLNRTKTSSKFLLTSRRARYAMERTQIRGFELEDEGIDFVKSRVQMYGLTSTQFTRSVIRDILNVCEGSPLFVQDLLRLCKVGETPHSATNKWRESGGEAARRYALGRELDMLSVPAHKALLTCAAYSGSASLAEIQVAANLLENECRNAVDELQELFLLPTPQLVEGQPRFSINVNTRKLVLDVEGDSDLVRRIRSAIKSIRNQTNTTPRDRGRIREYTRQAVSLVKLNKHSAAEAALLNALESHPENPDLHGMLGWVYKAWKPQVRYTDARNHFRRASRLKCKSKDTYLHWSRMESGRQEWTAGAQAAESGLKSLGQPSEELSFMAGISRSQSAKDLYQQAQYGRAEQEALKAEGHLKNALLDMDKIRDGQYQLHGRVYRATVLNYELLARTSEAQQKDDQRHRSVRLLSQALMNWEKEHPRDPNTSSERERLLYRFPDLGNHLHA